ncbi:MAG: hypothetical protein JSR66_15455 [Proteobacteria bacterium]|nr:hypothetical protein [Pseudomonadota bacterium]
MAEPTKRRPIRRWLFIFGCGVLLLLAAAAAVPSWRQGCLRSIGWLLVAQDELAPVDLIVLSSDSLAAGALEAADLVKAGYAQRVAVFDRPQLPVQRELIRRGAPPYDPAAFLKLVLHSQGVSDIVDLPSVSGTNDEGRVLRDWCSANSIHSVIFVSVRDHSRRTRRVLARTLGRENVRAIVRYTRWSEFDPDTWWHSRDGQRIEVQEGEKLLADILLHPF